MAPPSLSSQSEPLLPPKLANDQPNSLSPTSALSLKIIAGIRIVLGGACVIAPRWTCGLFGYQVPAAYAVMPRFFGVRDVALGELLYTAEDKTSSDGGRREIRRALFANVGTDAVDLATVVYAVATGNLGRAPAAVVGGGAVINMILTAVVFKGLRE